MSMWREMGKGKREMRGKGGSWREEGKSTREVRARTRESKRERRVVPSLGW